MTARPSDRLVGRAAELAAVEAALGELERRSFVALELAGEPGIGKTRMLAELAERADARGLLVLSGSASELERDLPFSLFVEALDDYIQALEPRRLDAIDDDVLAELAQVFPSLRAAAGAEPQDHRFRTHRAARRMLEALAEPKPLVLLLDDVHWADSGSIELLGSLLRRPPAAPVLIVAAVRPRQLPERLAAALERAQGDGALTRVDVAALSPDEAREMLGDAAAELYGETGGNPFYLKQLARSGQRPTDGAGAVSLAGLGVPRAVAATLADELAVLEAPVRSVLEGAAVAGDPFEPELAAAAAGVPESAALEALDELLRRDLVRQTDVPRRFRFRHPLVRGAVYEATSGGWRLGAHERCADLLALRGSGAAARAHHVEHAARYGDADAVAVLREAGEAVVQRTPAGAARWFGAALRLLPADAPAQERIGLLSARAGALAAAGQFGDARSALLDAIEIVPDEAVDLRARMTVACAGVEQLLGRYREVRFRLERALEELGDPVSPAGVALMLDLARYAPYRQDYESARHWAARALDAARQLGERSLIADAAAMLALASAFCHDVAAAQLHRSEAAALIDAMPDRELARHITATSNLYSAELYLDRLQDGIEHAERSVDVARATGQGQLFPALVPLLGALLTMRGRLAEAAEREDGAIEASRLAGNAQGVAWALFHRAFTAFHAGDLDTALAAGEESVALSRDDDESIVWCFAGMVLGLALIERGDRAAGADLVVARGGGEELPRVPGAWRAYFLDQLTRGQLACGRRDEAQRAAAAAAAIADATGLRFVVASARRAAARLALEADAPAAAEHALASAAAADELGAPLEAAVSRTLAGAALARAGDKDRALAELGRAAAELDALGATRHRDAAELELRQLGRRLHRRTRAGKADGTGIETLTERELEIARLIVDRRTNTQIAAELFLSKKTVESHIRNLFHKLDVSSRVDVARAVERADREAAR